MRERMRGGTRTSYAHDERWCCCWMLRERGKRERAYLRNQEKRILLYKPLSQQTGSDWHTRKKKRGGRDGTRVERIGRFAKAAVYLAVTQLRVELKQHVNTGVRRALGGLLATPRFYRRRHAAARALLRGRAERLGSRRRGVPVDARGDPAQTEHSFHKPQPSASTDACLGGQPVQLAASPPAALWRRRRPIGAWPAARRPPAV